jgi:asparagine synthase (glutamine-hydrolysing)
MCGIAGFVSSRRGIDIAEATRRMTAALARRGPDSGGLEQWPNAALGHRRLAILDLSPAGNQPMLSDDGETGIVFNGCIYNFRELRHELEQNGAAFHSHCDTEVLLQGYRCWGIDDLVRRLRGMFAFGIWDNTLRRLILVRDRLGVKPLVYWTGDGTVAFASTIAALRAADLGGEIDPGAVIDFLHYGFVGEEHAIYAGIRKLPPATILEWQDGKITERCYWALPEPRPGGSISFEEAVEETERRLVESVRLRLVSDVNVAALLSGGIDSALICWALTRLNANIRAYTVGASGDLSDETAAARYTASVLGIPHEVVELPADNPAPLDEMSEIYSEPFASQSALGMAAVSGTIGRHAKVLLTGDGGDEVFLGYPFFRLAWIAQRVAEWSPDAMASAWSQTWPKIRSSLPRAGILRPLQTLLNCSTQGLAGYIASQNGLAFYKRHEMLGERALDAGQVDVPPPSLESARHLLSELFAYQKRTYFTGEFMVKVDGATMHYAVEARSPLLDQQLWEFAAALPFSLRLHRGRLKAVLREICRRRIGARIANRRKQGFTVPVERWLTDRWMSKILSLRGETELVRDGWIRRGPLNSAVNTAVAQRRVPTQLWYLLVLENWLTTHKRVAVHAGGP